MAYARKRDYTGWDYGDGMSSKLLQALPIDNRVVNLVVQELIKRSPLNLRPLFLVEQRRNYKGAALFAMANLGLEELTSTTSLTQDIPVDYTAESRGLLDWLIENQAQGYHGFCLGHQHPIQDIQGLADANEPDSVCTSYGVKALLRAAELDPKYAEIAKSAAEFIVQDLEYRPTSHGARITYSQNHEGEYYTLNAGALAGRTFVDLFDHFSTEEYLRRSRKILDHVAAKQAPSGGWAYRDPPDASHLSMDTHHNGFIIECFQRYEAVVGDGRYDEVLTDSLNFFRRELFEDTGAPNFDENARYPKDIHACAQGILVFTYASDIESAQQVLQWTIDNLYGGAGRFHFRKHRFFTNRIVLMRWCQAWMAFALTEYLRGLHGLDPIGDI